MRGMLSGANVKCTAVGGNARSNRSWGRPKLAGQLSASTAALADRQRRARALKRVAHTCGSPPAADCAVVAALCQSSRHVVCFAVFCEPGAAAAASEPMAAISAGERCLRLL
jgi:hypothetical protein